MHLPERFSISGPDGFVLTRDDFFQSAERVTQMLQQQLPSGSRVALLAENSPQWAVMDFALQHANLVAVPLPTFFVRSQFAHLLASTPIQAVIMDGAGHERAFPGLDAGEALPDVGTSGFRLHRVQSGGCNRSATALGSKLTFTSGSTGAPKGIDISRSEQWQVAAAIAHALKPLGIAKHLCMLPLSVLLENIAGLYAGMLMSEELVVLPTAMTGLIGSSAFDAARAANVIVERSAESLILLPQMLRDLCVYLERSGRRLPSLKFVAVGGSRVPSLLIQRARELGMPVYEGYGLSEAGSVISLNLPGADRIGSVGRPLAHREISLAADGEVMFRSVSGQWTLTGDLGSIDRDGFLHITGRKKNILITSFGRNVSPEWPESLLLGYPEIAQAIVLGDGQPYLSALIVPAAPAIDAQRLQRRIDSVNRELPDYAQIRSWRRIDQPFTHLNGMATANGRPRRDVIAETYTEIG